MRFPAAAVLFAGFAAFAPGGAACDGCGGAAAPAPEWMAAGGMEEGALRVFAERAAPGPWAGPGFTEGLRRSFAAVDAACDDLDGIGHAGLVMWVRFAELSPDGDALAFARSSAAASRMIAALGAAGRCSDALFFHGALRLRDPGLSEQALLRRAVHLAVTGPGDGAGPGTSGP